MANPSKLPDGRRIKKYPQVCPDHPQMNDRYYYFRDHFGESSIDHITYLLLSKRLPMQIIKDFIYNGYPMCHASFCYHILAKPK